jgi:hypothetical protein
VGLRTYLTLSQMRPFGGKRLNFRG